MSFSLLDAQSGGQFIECDGNLVGCITQTSSGIVLRLDSRSPENIGRVSLKKGLARLEQIVRHRLSR